jgi:hypothetical protein
MYREIPRNKVDAKLLKIRLEAVGYEVRQDEDDDLFLFNNWVYLHITLRPIISLLLIRGYLPIKFRLTDDELQKICADANDQSLTVRYTTLRGDDGYPGLVGDHSLFYPSGLKISDLTFCIQQLADSMRCFREEYKPNDQLFLKASAHYDSYRKSRFKHRVE